MDRIVKKIENLSEDFRRQGENYFIETNKFGQIFDILAKNGARLITVTAFTRPGSLWLAYHFDLFGSVFTIKTETNKGSIGSITKKYPNADWIEREITEQYGIKFTNKKSKSKPNLILSNQFKTPLLKIEQSKYE